MKRRRLLLGVVVAIGLVGLLYASGIGQTLFAEWPNHMVFRPTSPKVRFDGTMTFEKLDGTALFTVGQSGYARYTKTYTQTLNPTAITTDAGPDVVSRTNDQTFTVTGLVSGDAVFINGPAPTSACPPIHARASTPDMLIISFITATATTCTPATGTYKITAVAS